MLRDIPVFPYGAQFREPERVAEAVCISRPVLLLQNDAILTVGGNVLQAFDRLEVAEFSARSLIDARSLGEFAPMDEREIATLEQRFPLR